MRGDDEVLEGTDILRKCRREKCQVTFCSDNPSTLMHGIITKVLGRRVVAELASVEYGHTPVIGHIVCCSFNHGARSGAFFGRVLDFSQGAKTTMVLEEPEDVLYVDARQAFRIPTTTNLFKWLVATIRTKQGEHSGRVQDMSRQGLCVKTSGVQAKRGQVVEIVVEREAKIPLHMQAAIASISDDTVGLMFEDPTDDWLDLANKVERAWIQSKRDLD